MGVLLRNLFTTVAVVMCLFGAFTALGQNPAPEAQPADTGLPPLPPPPPPPPPEPLPQPEPARERGDDGSNEDRPHAGRNSGSHRSFGVGTALGGGASGGVIFGGGGVASPALMLPTLELRIFLESGNSVQVSVPLLNAVIVSLVIGGPLVVVDGFYLVSFGDEGPSFFADASP